MKIISVCFRYVRVLDSMESKAFTGALNNMKIITNVHRLIELPIIHIINKFMGMFFAGPKATFHAR